MWGAARPRLCRFASPFPFLFFCLAHFLMSPPCSSRVCDTTYMTWWLCVSGRNATACPACLLGLCGSFCFGWFRFVLLMGLRRGLTSSNQLLDLLAAVVVVVMMVVRRRRRRRTATAAATASSRQTAAETQRISLAFCMFFVVVVLRYDDAAWVGTWTYFFSNGSEGRQSSCSGRQQQRASDPSEDLIKPSGAHVRVSFRVLSGSPRSRLR